jgi:hypothetical protein
MALLFVLKKGIAPIPIMDTAVFAPRMDLHE